MLQGGFGPPGGQQHQMNSQNTYQQQPGLIGGGGLGQQGPTSLLEGQVKKGFLKQLKVKNSIFLWSWEMKVLKKGCVRKLAVKWDPFYKRIAGSPRLLVTKRHQEKCKNQESRVWSTPSPIHGH